MSKINKWMSKIIIQKIVKHNKSVNQLNFMKRACKIIHPRGILKYVRVPYDTFENKQF